MKNWLMVDIESTALASHELALISRDEVGGVILFSRNYESKSQLRALTRSIKVANPECVIAVDHEGGRVQRFRDGFTRIPPMQALGHRFISDPHFAKNIAKALGWTMAAELIECGVDLSFAPVLDIDDNYSEIIGDRAFSAQPEVVIELASAFIQGMNEAGMAATGKHFPGHGGVKEDSHLELPVDHRALSLIEKNDMMPFAKLGDVLDGIMPAHVVYSEVDSKPAGFSHVWLQRVLREQLGFKGVIFSDDLTMEGAAQFGSYEERAYLALDAGCDVVLVCNNPEGAREVLKGSYSLVDTAKQRDIRRFLATKVWDDKRLRSQQYYADAQEFIASLSIT